MSTDYGFASCFFCESIVALSRLVFVKVPPKFPGRDKSLSPPKPYVKATACDVCVEKKKLKPLSDSLHAPRKRAKVGGRRGRKKR